MKKRIVWLDIVKLFTIYLVIIGHVTAMMVNGYAVIAPLLAFVFSVLCLYLIHILSKNRVADLLLFGGQYYKK